MALRGRADRHLVDGGVEHFLYEPLFEATRDIRDSRHGFERAMTFVQGEFLTLALKAEPRHEAFVLKGLFENGETRIQIETTFLFETTQDGVDALFPIVLKKTLHERSLSLTLKILEEFT